MRSRADIGIHVNARNSNCNVKTHFIKRYLKLESSLFTNTGCVCRNIQTRVERGTTKTSVVLYERET